MLRAFKPPFVIAASLLLFLALAVLTVQPAFAPTRVEIGPYVLIVGWETEPVVVGERNALFFDVSKEGQPVEGLESSLAVALLYGGQTFTGNLQPSTEPGIYTVEVVPTVRGQYSVQLSGSLEDLDINEVVEPEEVLPSAVLEFPESPPDTRAMQETINELSDQLQTSQLVSIIAIGLAILALVVAGFSMIRGRDKTK